MNVTSGPNDRPLLGLMAIVTIGFAMRAMNIEDQPLWGDEALTLMMAQWPYATLFLTPNDPTPGLYYALHKLLVSTDAGVAAARSISLVAGTAAIVATFGWARACRTSGYLAAALTAVCFALVDYSQEARAYSLLVLFVALSGWAFVRWNGERRKYALLSFGACLLLSFYTHFVAVFWIAPMIVAAILVARGDRMEQRKLAWLLCILAVFAVPEANRLLRYPPENFSWLSQSEPLDALNITSSVLLPFGYFENELWSLGPLLSAIAGAVAFGILGGEAFRHRAKLIDWATHNQAAGLSVLISISLPMTIWLFGYVWAPIFMPRTILIAAPGFFILVSLVFSFEPRIARQIVFAVYAFNLVLTGTVRTKEDWRSATQLLAANVRKGDVIWLCPGWKAFALRHALHEGLDAPLLIDLNGHVLQIESAMGHDLNWVNSYFDTLTQRRGFDDGQRAMHNAKRTWRITSSCTTN